MPIRDDPLAYEAIRQSPFLLYEYSFRLYRTGQLAPAEHAFADTVRISAAMNLRQLFLSSLAFLCRIRLRTGDLANAEIGLRFLAAECDHAMRDPSEEELPGEVFLALAAGSRLFGDRRAREHDYDMAIRLFARNGDEMQLLRAMLERLFDEEARPAGIREAHEWNLQAERCARLNPQAAPLAELARTMIAFRAPGSDPPQEEAWRRLLDTEREYPYGPLLRIVWLRASCASGRNGTWQRTGVPATDIRSIRDEVDGLLARHSEDLELRRQLIAIRLNLPDGGPELRAFPQAEAELKAICSILRLPFPETARTGEPADQREEISLERMSPSEAGNGRGQPPRLEREPSRRQDREQHPRPDREPSRRLKVQLFHGLKWYLDGEELPPVKWKRKKSRELLVYLLLQPSYSAVKEQLLEYLFGHCALNQGLNQLNVTLHTLKRWLSEQLGLKDMLATENGVVRIREHAIEFTDVEQYQELVRIGDQLWSEDRELAAELYGKAAALYGPLMPELPYAEWLQPRRAALEMSQAKILHRLSEEACGRNSWDEAEAHALAWVRLFPQQEEAYQMLIRIMLETGRKSEARTWFQRLEHMCRTELGAAPTEETIRMMGGAPT